MNWTEVLKYEVESTYSTTEKLLALVTDDRLGWKPSEGANWMTMGQLLKHLTQGCGMAFKALTTGDWGVPESEAAQLPPAEALPTVTSVAEAARALCEDKKLALDTLAAIAEQRLANEGTPVPWDPTRLALGHRLLQMVEHQKQHKGQLFYYLKLQGQPVGTRELWGA